MSLGVFSLVGLRGFTFGGPRTFAPKLSNSLINRYKRVNGQVSFGPRVKPERLTVIRTVSRSARYDCAVASSRAAGHPRLAVPLVLLGRFCEETVCRTPNPFLLQPTRCWGDAIVRFLKPAPRLTRSRSPCHIISRPSTTWTAMLVRRAISTGPLSPTPFAFLRGLCGLTCPWRRTA